MDKILINGAVYTMDSANPKAEAVAIKDNIIKAVGSSDKLLKIKTRNTEVIDMKGAMVLPGLIDAHCHPAMTAFFKGAVQFDEEMSLEEVLETLKKAVKANPDKDSYVGMGYNEFIFENLEYSVDLLDEICPDKPVILMGSGFHACWVNSKTFELAQITEATPDPVPGYQYFGRDKNGKLTGHVVECEPENMIFRKVNFFDRDILEKSYEEMSEEFSRVGVTSFAGCGNYDWMGEDAYAIPARMTGSGRLGQRFFECTFVETADRAEPALEELIRLSKIYDNDKFRVNTYKVILDGTFETKSASVSYKYVDGYEPVKPILEGEAIKRMYEKVASYGFDIHTHAIGDRAARAMIDGAEAVRAAGFDDIRLTNAHTQYVAKEDRKKFGELNIIANTSGGWHYWYPGIEEIMGPIHKEEFMLKEIMDGGAIMTMGSDRPADEVGYDPRTAIATAMTRRYAGFFHDPKMLILEPENQKLSLQSCLEAYTVNAAYQLHMENKLGQLKEGAYADITVFEKDMFKIEPEEILNDKVIMTIFDGRVVYRDN